MRAVKGNKEYTINETQKKGYQDGGFDILDENGGIIAYGRGKTVSYDDYMKAAQEIERLQKRVADLEAATAQEKEPEKEPVKKAESKKAGE